MEKSIGTRGCGVCDQWPREVRKMKLSEEVIHHSPISEHCEAVLEDLEQGKIPCYDFRKSRSAVMCLAFKIMEEEKSPRLQVSRAWQNLRQKCKRD